jgi:transcriptional regulator with XRE-family HTH domain
MNQLREIRFVRRLTQMNIFQRTGIWPSKLSAIENGFISPTEAEKIQLADVLGMDKDWIFPEVVAEVEEMRTTDTNEGKGGEHDA